ncbi:MAG: FAD-dependent oxidoreductase [Mycobacteriaceae bacterium]
MIPAAPDGRAFDLAVIGGGTAGIVAARTAARFGASVLLVERNRTGGDCLWTGCVPSKALLAAAHAAAAARSAARLGVHTGRVRVDFSEVMAHVHAAVAAVEPDDSPATLEAAGVRVVIGGAELTGPDTLTVDGHPVRFRQAVVATGAQPKVPDGLAGVRTWTSETLWGMTEQPKRLLVLGGGPVGCELGQAFARLGSAVTLVQRGPRLLPAEDPAAAAAVTDALRADGVDVRLATSVTGVADGSVMLADGTTVAVTLSDGTTVAVTLSDGTTVAVTLSDGTTVAVTDVLVAAGRTPRTSGLGLAARGVELDRRGFVVVDDTLRTTNPRIWAAGDVTAVSRFTHTAGVHGSTAASNAVLGLRRKVDDSAVPRVTFTHPEVAAVGRRHGSTVRTVAHTHTDRAIAEGDTGGFARLVLDRRGRVVGATVVGPRAGETLAELTLAVRTGVAARTLAATTHPYPTWGDAPWTAAVAQVQNSLDGPVLGRTMRGLTRLRRRRLRRDGGV